jgi:hypothetical protein
MNGSLLRAQGAECELKVYKVESNENLEERKIENEPVKIFV